MTPQPSKIVESKIFERYLCTNEMICFLCFFSWYTQSSKATSGEKDTEAKVNIRQYYAWVINGVRHRFTFLSCCKFCIYTHPINSKFTTQHFIGSEETKTWILFVTKALNNLYDTKAFDKFSWDQTYIEQFTKNSILVPKHIWLVLFWTQMPQNRKANLFVIILNEISLWNFHLFLLDWSWKQENYPHVYEYINSLSMHIISK